LTVYIGIDPGVHTGMAFYCVETKKMELETMSVVEAMIKLQQVQEENTGGHKIVVFIEDPNQNQPIFSRHKVPEFCTTVAKRIDYICKKAQDVGRNKEDAFILMKWMDHIGMEYHALRPNSRSNTKLTAKQFEMRTGYKGRSNEHTRDAGMLVYGR